MQFKDKLKSFLRISSYALLGVSVAIFVELIYPNPRHKHVIIEDISLRANLIFAGILLLYLLSWKVYRVIRKRKK